MYARVCTWSTLCISLSVFQKRDKIFDSQFASRQYEYTLGDSYVCICLCVYMKLSIFSKVVAGFRTDILSGFSVLTLAPLSSLFLLSQFVAVICGNHIYT